MSRELCWWSRIHYITSKQLTAVWECACALTFHHHTHTHTHTLGFFLFHFIFCFFCFYHQTDPTTTTKTKKWKMFDFPSCCFCCADRLRGISAVDRLLRPLMAGKKKSRVDRVMSDWPLNQIIPSNNKQTTTTTTKRKFSQTSKFGKKIKDVAITRFPNLIQVAYDDSAYYVVVVLLRNMYYASVHDCGCAGIGLDGRRRS